MTRPTTAPYGEWVSPFPISLLTAGVVSLGEIRAADGVRWWLEGRPDEQGRQVLIRRATDGTETRLTPEGFNTRTRVHEYGGAAYVVDGDLVVVSDFATGRLDRIEASGELRSLTPEQAWRFADFVVDRARNRLVAIREDHELDTIARHGEAENSLVAIDLARGAVTVLAAGADFFAAPRLSPDGRRLAFSGFRDAVIYDTATGDFIRTAGVVNLPAAAVQVVETTDRAAVGRPSPRRHARATPGAHGRRPSRAHARAGLSDGRAAPAR